MYQVSLKIFFVVNVDIDFRELIKKKVGKGLKSAFSSEALFLEFCGVCSYGLLGVLFFCVYYNMQYKLHLKLDQQGTSKVLNNLYKQ